VVAQVVTLVVPAIGMVAAAGQQYDKNLYPCSGPVERWRSFALVLASIAGFVFGHMLTRWLDSNGPLKARRRTVDELPTPLRDGGGTSSRRLGQVALVGLLLFGCVALAYETWGVFGDHPPYPITWAVRCLANSSGWASVVAGAFAVCFLLGHWVWYPADTPDA
jgi:hypothetical protein